MSRRKRTRNTDQVSNRTGSPRAETQLLGHSGRFLVRLEHWVTLLGALAGLFSLFWQINESVRQREEKLRVSFGYPVQSREDSTLFSLPIEIINHGERVAYVQEIGLELPFFMRLEPDSALSIEPGAEGEIFTAPVPLADWVRLGTSGVDVEIQTTRSRRVHTVPLDAFDKFLVGFDYFVGTERRHLRARFLSTLCAVNPGFHVTADGTDVWRDSTHVRLRYAKEIRYLWEQDCSRQHQEREARS
jgi:hypothetical protein